VPGTREKKRFPNRTRCLTSEKRVPATCSRDLSITRKRVPIELLHTWLVHRKCHTLLTASKHKLWEDTKIRIKSKVGCMSGGIATIRSTARNKAPHVGACKAGEYVFLDIKHPITFTGLTPSNTYKFYLIVVDAYSHYVRIYRLGNKSTKAVIQALKDYKLEHSSAAEYCYVNIESIRADHGSQFTSAEFLTYCQNAGVNLVLAAPKKQYQNNIAEHTWQTVSAMARSLLMHAWLPDTFWYHALQYSTFIFNILPVKGLVNNEEWPPLQMN